MSEIKPVILSIGKFFEKFDRLKIPRYQRPYRWKERNVIQLLEDIQNCLEDVQKGVKEKDNSYRIGTIILHEDNEDKNGNIFIVDGQQRLVTITLILKCLGHDVLPLSREEFEHPDSKRNIALNFRLIQRWFENHLDKHQIKSFLLDNCEFVTLVLSEIEEAFQLFDSQNARGKPLEPFDLLKAFHLREMINNSPNQKIECAEIWERLIDEDKLGNILGHFLFRIRKWSSIEILK